MDHLSETLTVLLGAGSARLLGPLGSRILIGPIRIADAGVIASLLLGALLANAAVAAAFRRWARPQAGAEASVGQYVLAALRKPAYALIWAYALVLAATFLLGRFAPGKEAEAARSLAGAALDLCAFALVFWFLFRATRGLDDRLSQWFARTPGKLDDLLLRLVGKSLRVMVPVLGVVMALPVLHLPADYADAVGKGTSILMIVAVAAVLFQAVRIAERAVLLKYDVTAADNLRARQVHTKVHIISRVADVIVGVSAAGSVLMLFSAARHIGDTLLASAGVLGVVVGFAAQKTMANLFAGFQIALTQPIREDDVVIVEGEWGRVEEITLTYVVVRIWDDRRLVVPLSYFIEKPFQNWTRSSADLLGSVHVWVDYSFPVEEARGVLKRIIESHPLWDRRFWNLQVTEATDRAMQLRILVTASNSSASWDLRCEVREKFIRHIQQHYPDALPQLRTRYRAVTGDLLPVADGTA